MGTFDDNRRHHAARGRVVPAHRVPARPAGRRHRAAARTIERFPFVPADPPRLEQDCYEAYNIQVAGLEQRLRALDYPKVVIGVSGGLDSTHALIVAARAMDREGRPRSDILAFTMPGFATSEHTKANAIALMRALGVTFAEIDIRDTAELMLAEMGHPFARGEQVYDVTFENVQAGLRTDYLFRLANQHGGIVLGTGDLSELALGWSHLWRRRPDVALQRQRRRAEDADPAPDPLGDLVAAVRDAGRRQCCSRCSTPRSLRSWSRRRGAKRCRAARPRSAPMRCRTFRCSTCCATDSGRRRSPSWPGMPGAMPSRATGRRASPRTSDRHTR